MNHEECRGAPRQEDRPGLGNGDGPALRRQERLGLLLQPGR